MRSVLRKAIILGVAVGAAYIGGCSSDSKSPSDRGGAVNPGNVGELGLQLQIGSTNITTVHYVISNGTNTRSGDLDVADASHLLAVIGGIPAGTGYSLVLTAPGTDCGGSAGPFDVQANQTTVVAIALICGARTDAGSVKIEGTVAQCAAFNAVSAAVPSGMNIQLSATTQPASPTPPTAFNWTGGSPGGLSASNIANPVYHCNGTENRVDLDVQMTQSNASGVITACTQVFHLIINCPVTGTTTTGTGGTGGATGGTGGTGGATGGTGGATGGTGGATGGTGGTTGGTGGTTGGTGGTTGGTGGTGGGTPTLDCDCNGCVSANGGDQFLTGCESFTGVAAAGPAVGVSLQVLCHEVLDCIHASNCHSNAITDCYCGTGAPDLGVCNTTTTAANGVCKTAFDRALEVAAGSAGSVAIGRMTDISYAGGMAGAELTFENTACPDVCLPYTPTGTTCP